MQDERLVEKNSLSAIQLEKIAKAYDSDPWWYDLRGFLILTFCYRDTLWRQIRFFGNNISSNHLECAIGSGTLLQMILFWRKFKGFQEGRIIGFDYAEPMLAGAISKFRRSGSVQLSVADAANMKYPAKSFESINVANAIHCFNEVDRAIQEIHRVLRPGGKAAINVLLYPTGNSFFQKLALRIANWGMRKGILFMPYEKQDFLNRVIRVGFKVVSNDVRGNAMNVLLSKEN